MEYKNKRDKDWLDEVNNILNEITEMSLKKVDMNSRRNNMRRQLRLLKIRMGYSP